MCSYEYPDFSSNFVHLPNFFSELDHTKFSESLNGSNVSYQDPRLKLSNLQSSVEPLSQYWYLAGLSHHLDRLPNLFLGNGYARTNPWPPINIKKKKNSCEPEGTVGPRGQDKVTWGAPRAGQGVPEGPHEQDRPYLSGLQDGAALKETSLRLGRVMQCPDSVRLRGRGLVCHGQSATGIWHPSTSRAPIGNVVPRSRPAGRS